jgi:hypothetical protein
LSHSASHFSRSQNRLVMVGCRYSEPMHVCRIIQDQHANKKTHADVCRHRGFTSVSGRVQSTVRLGQRTTLTRSEQSACMVQNVGRSTMQGTALLLMDFSARTLAFLQHPAFALYIPGYCKIRALILKEGLGDAIFKTSVLCDTR